MVIENLTKIGQKGELPTEVGEGFVCPPYLPVRLFSTLRTRLTERC